MDRTAVDRAAQAWGADAIRRRRRCRVGRAQLLDACARAASSSFPALVGGSTFHCALFRLWPSPLLLSGFGRLPGLLRASSLLQLERDSCSRPGAVDRLPGNL